MDFVVKLLGLELELDGVAYGMGIAVVVVVGAANTIELTSVSQTETKSYRKKNRRILGFICYVF